ncbi:MAG: VOC family protein [Bdellovibrionaceae bacterium]|nr:VOC family protein [Pseudobdellovibrionaceae bacterium]
MSHPLMQQALPFLEALGRDLERRAFALPAHWDVDHLCYRVGSLSRYIELREELRVSDILLTETPVNGRPIACFQLRNPLFWREVRIDVIELPAPKAGRPTPEGFEHIEIVADQSFQEIQRADLPFELSPKNFNAELKLELGERNLKFHHLSLHSVVRMESHTRAAAALKNSRILEDFASFRPLVAGTFPLGLDTLTSDLDLLFVASDLDALDLELRRRFATCVSFRQQRLTVDELTTSITNFVMDDVPFEIFAQNREPVLQRAYRHFLIEEKLLKYGGEKLRDRVVQARARGLKTEPAFGEALGLQGDPYLELLQWQELSVGELRQRLERALA